MNDNSKGQEGSGQADIVAMLETALVSAKAGQLSGVAMACMTIEGIPLTISRGEGRFGLVVALEHLKNCLVAATFMPRPADQAQKPTSPGIIVPGRPN